MTHKVIQVAGLAVVGIATVVFVATLVNHHDDLTGVDMDTRTAFTITGSFLSGIAGIGVFMLGRLIGWWKRN